MWSVNSFQPLYDWISSWIMPSYWTEPTGKIKWDQASCFCFTCSRENYPSRWLLLLHRQLPGSIYPASVSSVTESKKLWDIWLKTSLCWTEPPIQFRVALLPSICRCICCKLNGSSSFDCQISYRSRATSTSNCVVYQNAITFPFCLVTELISEFIWMWVFCTFLPWCSKVYLDLPKDNSNMAVYSSWWGWVAILI